jgi:hypothetical protein
MKIPRLFDKTILQDHSKFPQVHSLRSPEFNRIMSCEICGGRSGNEPSRSLFLATAVLPALRTHISFMYRRRYINLSLTASLNKTLTGSHNLMIEYAAYGVTDFCNSKAGNEALPNPTCSGRHRRWSVAQLC